MLELLAKKSEKKIEQFSIKCQNGQFWANLGPNWAKFGPEDKFHNMALYTCLKCLLCFNF